MIAKPPAEEDLETRAIRIAAALELISDEVQKLIDGIREHQPKEEAPDARPES